MNNLPSITAEQRARDILTRMGIKGAQSYRPSVVIEIANLIVDNQRLENKVKQFEQSCFHLRFIYQRMVNIHKENKNVDYMLKFKKIISEFVN